MRLRPVRFVHFVCAVLCTLTAIANAVEPTWRPLSPGIRAEFSVAFDRQRGVAVLFGGVPDYSPQSEELAGDTWEWDGHRWRQRFANGPAPRELPVMAYDEGRDVLVLWGGYDGVVNPDETWEWDGNTWALRATGATESQYFATMAYDAARGVIVLVNGLSTWTWDGATWTLASATAPPGQRSRQMVYDRIRGVIVLVNAEAPTTPCETWEWDGASWTLRSTSGLGHREAFSMVYDERNNQVLVIDGYDSTYASYDDTMAWDGTTWTRVGSGPARYTGPLLGEPAWFDSTRNTVSMYAYGVQDWDGSAWQERSPGGVKYHAMTYDSARDEVILFGGLRHTSLPGNSIEFGNTWALGHDGWGLRATDGPSPRYDTAMAFDEAREVVVLFGGRSLAQPTNLGDTWEWDGASWTLRATTGPPTGVSSAMAYDAARGVTVLVNNVDPYSLGLQTWEWDGNAWTQRYDAPTDRANGAKLVYDRARGKVVLTPPLDHPTVREWDGTSWTTITPTDGPQFSQDTVAGYDPLRDRIIAYGLEGRYADTRPEAWEWDGTDWHMTAIDGPLYRYSTAAAYDTTQRVLVMHGGVNVGGNSTIGCDTWAYGTGIPGDFDIDGDVDLTEFDVFRQCANGASRPPAESCPPGVNADLDDDGDVDMSDYLTFAQNFTGAR